MASRHLCVVALLALLASPGCGDSTQPGADAAPGATDARVNDAFWGCGALWCTAGCDGTLLCQSPVAGKVSMCGQLVDLAANQLLRDPGATGTLCDPMNPTTDGPCTVAINAYDSLEFAIDPAVATPLNAGRIQVDDCGRFRMESIDYPSNGSFITLAVNNNPLATADPWIRSAQTLPITPDVLLSGLRKYVVDKATDQSWTDTAGNPFAFSTFSQRGAHAAIFLTGEPSYSSDPAQTDHQRAAGVQVSDATTFYMSDADPNSATTVDVSQQRTGANGIALIVDLDPGPITATGANHQWPSHRADTVPNVLLTREYLGDPD